MSDWKKRFPATVFIRDLPAVGAFRIVEEPESLGKGKYRFRAVKPDGSSIQCTTFDGTIGSILEAQGPKGYAEAYYSEETNSKGEAYINFRAAEVKP